MAEDREAQQGQGERGEERVAVVGEVDLATAHLLRDRLLGVLREQTPPSSTSTSPGSPSWTAPGSAPWLRSATPPSAPAARCGSPIRNPSCGGYST
jgi:hypothetical protein